MVEPNVELRQARLRVASPVVPGESLSRRELAEAVNAWIFEHCARRMAELDETYISKLERASSAGRRTPSAVPHSAPCSVSRPIVSLASAGPAGPRVPC